MQIKNLKLNNNIVKTKIAACILAGTLAVTTLTGCGNHDIWDTEHTFNKAIVFDGNRATIIDIKQWADYDGEQYQLITKDGLVIITSSYDTKLLNDKDSETSAEDVARAIKGDNVEICYLNEVSKTKRK